MNDPIVSVTANPRVPRGIDSHAAATKPSHKPALPDGANLDADQAPKALDLRSAVPLHVRPVLTYAEVAALGIAPERSLRRLVAMGRVKRAVLRVGRSVRFVVRDLIDELRQENG
ncbi:MAG: hypothetical protein IT456_21420 [Planctomycetes bacterium]|jgi:hypothetical protein|nr:hypothetical protein [Planctomycetota bacterium]